MSVRFSSLLILFASLALPGDARAAARPNVVLIMTDDQGYGDLRCHGNAMIKTPNLDRLHAHSVRFTDFHVDPTCSPTRAALMTGRYSTRTGVWHTVMGRSILFEDEVTLAEVFRAAGYQTGIFGKWHLGDNFPSRPEDRGFTESFIHGGGGVGQTPDFWGNDYFDDTYRRNGQWTPNRGYCTRVFFDQALRFIEKNRRRPFFCYLPTNVPHSPYRVAEKYSRPYLNQGAPPDMARFYGMITEFDENLGRLMRHLDRLGLTDNTILIFMTDNGTAAGQWWKRSPTQKPPRWTGFNAGMKGGKGSHYDGGHRVPFFIQWPAEGIGGGRDVDRLAAHIDVLPTLAELCGLSLPKDRRLDGRSLVPLLRGNEKDWPDRTLFAHFQREEIPPKWVRSAVMTERWRLIDGKELYDIKADPGQSRDISRQHDDVVLKLRAEYEKWWQSLTPAFERYGWIKVGTPHENPSRITCHDWHSDLSEIPWNQDLIRRRLPGNGYWMVEFASSGVYSFTLQQIPGEPIDAARAAIAVGHREVTADIPPGAASVTLTLPVTAGKKRLISRLIKPGRTPDNGAYFIDVRRVE